MRMCKRIQKLPHLAAVVNMFGGATMTSTVLCS